MADQTWGAGSGPQTSDINTGTNWTGDTVPGGGDTGRFNSTDVTNAQTSGNWDPDQVIIENTYSGTVTLANQTSFDDANIDGTMVLRHDIILGAPSGNGLEIESGGSISKDGAGQSRLFLTGGVGATVSKLDGTIDINNIIIRQNNCILVAGDYSGSSDSCQLLITNNTGGDFNFAPSAGNYSAGSFVMNTSGAGALNVNFSTNNPNFDCAGQVYANSFVGNGNWTNGNGIFTVGSGLTGGGIDISGLNSYIKGSGKIVLASSAAATVNFSNFSMEEIEVTGSGTQTLGSNLTTDRLDVQAGIFQVLFTNSVTATNFEASGGTLKGLGGSFSFTLTNAGTSTGTTFQDIAMNAANKINAKDATNTNSGGTKGIIFEDSFGGF